MSSYSSLLPLSAGGYVDDGDDGDDMAVAGSYLSFDIDDDGEDYCLPAVFHAEEPAQFLASPQGAEAGSYNSGRVASCGSDGVGERSRQSQMEIAMLGGSERFCSSNHGKIDMRATSSVGGSSRRSSKIAFKTRSEVEVLDDGYRWRKYGKKMVKNSSNPRNYYRCSSDGCRVKKQVERERDDARFVITTYDGIHNHPAAPLPLPRGYSPATLHRRRVEEGSSPLPVGSAFLTR